MFGKIAAGIGALILAVLVAIFMLPRNQTWSPDGIIYAEIMLEDLGLKDHEAQVKVRQFYSTKPLAQNRLYQNLLTDHPQESFVKMRVLFRPRVVYPYLGSLLYPHAGFDALVYVSIAAYVIGVISVYVLVVSFSPPWIAFLGACVFGLNSEIRSLGSAALTDMLGVALWTSALACSALYVQRASRSTLLLYAFITLALAFTRPILFLPLGASVGVLLWARGRYGAKDVRTRNMWLLFLVTVAAGLVLALVSFLTHAAGINAMRWGYERWIELGHDARTTLAHWYILSIVQTIRGALADILWSGAVLGWVAILAKLRDRSDSVTPLLAGAGIASLIGIILNPIPSDLTRVIEAPLWPVVIAGYAIVFNAILKRALPSKQGSVA